MPQDPRLTVYARQMRAAPTEAEAWLWRFLRGRQLGVKFRRQMPLGPYIVDFVCLSHRLIVEVDGTHHGPTNRHDQRRDDWLRSEGFQVIRFANDDLRHQRQDVVLDAIAQALTAPRKERPPDVPPAPGGL